MGPRRGEPRVAAARRSSYVGVLKTHNRPQSPRLGAFRWAAEAEPLLLQAGDRRGGGGCGQGLSWAAVAEPLALQAGDRCTNEACCEGLNA